MHSRGERAERDKNKERLKREEEYVDRRHKERKHREEEDSKKNHLERTSSKKLSSDQSHSHEKVEETKVSESTVYISFCSFIK